MPAGYSNFICSFLSLFSVECSARTNDCTLFGLVVGYHAGRRLQALLLVKYLRLRPFPMKNSKIVGTLQVERGWTHSMGIIFMELDSDG